MDQHNAQSDGTHYDVLGVRPGASEDEVETIVRTIAFSSRQIPTTWPVADPGPATQMFNRGVGNLISLPWASR